MNFWLYILKNKENGQYYVGQTKDIKERLERHNTNRSKFTSGKGKWVLAYKEKYSSRKEAIRREREIKSKKSRKFIKKLIMNYRGVEE